jgi:L-threonylcarbamoyladenylate synthase
LGSTDARLAARFWPGPLSLVFDAPASVAPETHAGRRSIAIRVPAHAVARSLCEAFGGPVTATSANRAGAPPARAAGELGSVGDDPHVLIIDGGEVPGGAPSTIVDARARPPLLVREGAISWTRVLESLQE